MNSILLVNFGGPRSLAEVESFLAELLCDRDVVRTWFPKFVHNWFFGRVAKKRAKKVAHDYEAIGGKSPIYFDTELLAQKLGSQVLTFHRYLPATHQSSLEALENSSAEEIRVLPLFPQFCYATTGSIARFFTERLSIKALSKLRWIQSYAGHEGFVSSYQHRIRTFLQAQNIAEKEVVLLFSAHGVPQSFINEGDIYKSECELSFQKVMQAFPNALGHLCYQSKFGRGEWLRPYTNEACEEILSWNQERKHVVVVPISFTSDHIETLFEIEELYLPVIRANRLNAHRCPALNLEPQWIQALGEILQSKKLCFTEQLVRPR
ncbi:MAG TPA: ferrochelatase [Chlamydiales bacterium]